MKIGVESGGEKVGCCEKKSGRDRVMIERSWIPFLIDDSLALSKYDILEVKRCCRIETSDCLKGQI